MKDLPEGKYFFKAKIKGTGMLSARFFYQGGSSKAIRFRTDKNGSWKEVSGSIELSAGKTKIYLVLQQGASKGDLQIDDVSLTFQK